MIVSRNHITPCCGTMAQTPSGNQGNYLQMLFEKFKEHSSPNKVGEHNDPEEATALAPQNLPSFVEFVDGRHPSQQL
ncbi:hypothetical protein [Bradyrhizobium septentrionale]|uniref:Uncharacterized protein n=1 Tax=Bradyrhizobium septentrionale TaxID=1404411 RepID=A0A974A0A1_9BRAD|nr:hypothetical protein [Bradyrhizobium septentrionale]UGY13861.1 hypothetical protein HAP48_0035625 [Bradyrhizobium septentrionale]UGY22413.1 hypothetical protein HU675_0031115 [Bradyrhizobium septentrionale]